MAQKRHTTSQRIAVTPLTVAARLRFFGHQARPAQKGRRAYARRPKEKDVAPDQIYDLDSKRTGNLTPRKPYIPAKKE